jgi:hypothetical protein
MNGDGWADLLVLTDVGTVRVYTHSANPALPYSGTPSIADLLGTPVPKACGLAIADVDGDGIMDVLISDETGRIWEFHGNGDL